uniref:Uncharacterized protein n=1 Tax=Anopheles merus TaxID=30066 RepID=A0A182UVS4_ANOME
MLRTTNAMPGKEVGRQGSSLCTGRIWHEQTLGFAGSKAVALWRLADLGREPERLDAVLAGEEARLLQALRLVHQLVRPLDIAGFAEAAQNHRVQLGELQWNQRLCIAICADTFSQANSTGAVARPSFRSAAAGLPIASELDTKSSRSSTNWKASPRLRPYWKLSSAICSSAPDSTATCERGRKGQGNVLATTKLPQRY